MDHDLLTRVRVKSEMFDSSALKCDLFDACEARLSLKMRPEMRIIDVKTREL